MGTERGVQLDKEGAVGIITMNRPPANSYDTGFARELAAVIDDVRTDDDLGAVVLRSASEKFFSAGADLAAFRANTPRQRSMTVLIMHEALRKMENTPLIFIAEIRGHALGGGLEISLACDLRFAAKGEYRLGLPETNLGLFPANGGTQRLPRLVGKSRGLELIIKARTFSAEGAEKLGIVDRLFETAAECREKTLEFAAELAAGPREAIGRAKITTTLGFDAPLDLGNALEREAIGSVFASEDAAEGISAFLEKRKPEFKGR
ncbi:MAG: enoyl-CoA hydratase/isomerase family protein [Candidatus Dormibacteraeota bacterium]|nr:enoyl-CoA hydratase/isomerase family protein [Candidatus Dormibacteraeota bacterium]